jgi:protein SCO1/2
LRTLLALALYAKTLHLDGLVIAVDPPNSRITVSHKAIPGIMPAMVMPVKLASPRRLKPGDRITFDLKNGFARNIKIFDARNEGVSEFKFPLPPETVQPGQPVPDFTLTDHLNRPTSLKQFSGKVVLVNFIYTRCPLPEVCPRLTAAFAALSRRFAAQDVQFLSITLDPSYDTPSVLGEYAKRSGARSDRWRFLTGDTAPAARLFGLVHWAEEGVIVHTSSTAVIGRDGRLVAIVEGSSFRLEQLADLVQHAL